MDYSDDMDDLRSQFEDIMETKSRNAAIGDMMARLIAHGSTPAEAWEAIPDIEHIEFWGLMKLLQGRIPMRPNRPAATGFQPDTDTDLQTQTRDR